MAPRFLTTVALLAFAGLFNHARADEASSTQNQTHPEASAGKASDLVIESQVQAGAGAGGSTRVALRISGARDPGGATLRYTVTGPGRLLRQDETAVPVGQQAVREIDVKLDPTLGTGRVYLNVFTSQGGRPGVVSVAVGGQDTIQKAAHGVAKRDASGQALVVVPAAKRP